MAYKPGDVVILRDVAAGAILFAWPLRVVGDSARGLLLSQRPGVIGKVTRGYPNDHATLLNEIASTRPTLVDLAWSSTVTLGIFTSEQWWSTRLMWDAATGDFLCYYVDFRRPIRRIGACVDTLDLGLDIVVTPDGHWQWKDEDHMPLIRAAGWLDGDGEAELEAAKADAVTSIEKRSFPFDDSLLTWRPDSGALHELPEGWNQPSTYAS